MYWLCKFYGPTVLFAPKDEGVDAPDPDDAGDDAGDEPDDAGDDAGDEPDDAGDDAGDEPDDAGDDVAEGDDDTGSTGASSASRRESRNARQARENRELRDRTARLEGELSALKKPPVDTAEARRTRDEKLALMSPEERMAFEAKEETAALRNEARNTQFMVLDMADKNSYEILCTRDSAAAKHKPEVEKLLGEMRKNGTNAPRETLLDYIIGRRARMSSQTKTGKNKIAKRKEEASARVNQSKSKPMSARGDTAAGGKGEETVGQMRERLLAREARGDVN